MKHAVLLLNLGGPDTANAVQPFLYNLFSDPDIIKLPPLLQKPLAWYISTNRAPEVSKFYKEIGGGSPILPLTQAQAQALEKRLSEMGIETPVFIAMRYWHPFTDEAVQQIKAQNIDSLIVLPLYPQFSYTTTASSVNELNRVIAKHYGSLAKGPKITIINNFFAQPDYQAALADTIQEALDNNCWSCPKESVQIVFSAHSLPKRHVRRMKDPYPDQIMETARNVMDRYFQGQPWEMAYQSKVGRMPWLGPMTEGLIQYFAALEQENILLVPISFVSEHLETLYEIDKLYIPLANEIGIPHCHRARALNDHPRFIEALAKLVRQKVESLKVPHLVIE